MLMRVKSGFQVIVKGEMIKETRKLSFIYFIIC